MTYHDSSGYLTHLIIWELEYSNTNAFPWNSLRNEFFYEDSIVLHIEELICLRDMFAFWMLSRGFVSRRFRTKDHIYIYITSLWFLSSFFRLSLSTRCRSYSFVSRRYFITNKQLNRVWWSQIYEGVIYIRIFLFRYHISMQLSFSVNNHYYCRFSTFMFSKNVDKCRLFIWVKFDNFNFLQFATLIFPNIFKNVFCKHVY